MRKNFGLGLILLLLVVSAAFLPVSRAAAQPNVPSSADDMTVVTKHQISISGKILKYTARAGFLPIRDQFGETKAKFFYVAYTLDDPANKARRPITFAWNGGPGAPSSMLHFSLIGPRRRFSGDKANPPESYPVVDNAETLLTLTDLVMVDPIGTGYSYPLKPEYGQLFWGVPQDIDSIAEFIRIYLTHYEALEAPIFLVGESYGTFRAAGVAQKLVDKEYSLLGVIMISSLLTIGPDGDLSMPLLLPSCAAAAFYHKKLPPDLQTNLESTLRQAEAWAETGYTVALMKGDRLGGSERKEAVANMARFTGLDPATVDKNNLRVSADLFAQQLLASEKKTIGHYDSRLKGENGGGPYDPTKDPSLFARGGNPFLFTTYLRSELEFKIDRPYQGPFGGFWPPSTTPRGDWMSVRWEWGSLLDNKLDQSSALASAIRTKDDLHVLFASGLYDLSTPYFSTEHAISHLGLDPKLRARVDHRKYAGGHMMYEDNEVRPKLMQDILSFVQSALRTGTKSGTKP